MRQFSEKTYRPTWVEINLKAIEHNFRLIKRIVGKNVKVLCVVKADAYGHGMLEVSRRLVKLKADYLGVASIEEGIELRRAGVHTPALLFENILPQFAEVVVKNNLTATVCDEAVAKALSRYCARHRGKAKVHLKVDTGMGRLGVWHEEALGFIKKILHLPGIFIEGMYTHFPCADSDTDFTQQQINDFKRLIKEVEGLGIKVPIYHVANSMGKIGFPQSHLDMVRAGLMLYGLYPHDSLKGKISLRPALTFKSKIIFLKHTPQGRSISYGRTYLCPAPSLIATLPVGYNDGYLRVLSNRSEVLYKGRRFSVVGRVCMDQLMVNLRDFYSARTGDTVTLVGREGREEISLEELARLAGTINYELACLLGGRARRVYRY
ncbi:MAG: alanine racemase [Candidatus Omnitrophota bacterium]